MNQHGGYNAVLEASLPQAPASDSVALPAPVVADLETMLQERDACGVSSLTALHCVTAIS